MERLMNSEQKADEKHVRPRYRQAHCKPPYYVDVSTFIVVLFTRIIEKYRQICFNRDNKRTNS
jgi:hypothetical protein